MQGIAPHYYGKRPLQSDLLTLKVAAMAEAGAWKEISPMLDSLLKLEPGTPFGSNPPETLSEDDMAERYLQR